MARKAGSNGTDTAAAIRRAALELTYARGFEGFGLRELAQRVGLQPASLYNHFTTKQDLLFGLISSHMTTLITATEAVLAACPPDPAARLRAFAGHHLAYHLDKKLEVYVANFELRALDAEHRDMVLAQRRRYEALLIAILDAGQAQRAVPLPDTHVAAYAMLAMLTGACTWYRPDGKFSRAKLIDFHLRLLLTGWNGAPPATPQNAITGEPNPCTA